MSKVGLTATFYFEIVSTIAIVFSLAAAYLFDVGVGMGQISASAGAAKGAADAAQKAVDSHTTFGQFFLNVFPDNFFGVFARGELLQVLVSERHGCAHRARLVGAQLPRDDRGSLSSFSAVCLIFRINLFGLLRYIIDDGSRGTPLEVRRTFRP